MWRSPPTHPGGACAPSRDQPATIAAPLALRAPPASGLRDASRFPLDAGHAGEPPLLSDALRARLRVPERSAPGLTRLRAPRDNGGSSRIAGGGKGEFHE